MPSPPVRPAIVVVSHSSKPWATRRVLQVGRKRCCQAAALSAANT